MTKAKVETTYDPTIGRWRSQVVKDGQVLFAAIRAKRESAEWNAEMWLAYNKPEVEA